MNHEPADVIPAARAVLARAAEIYADDPWVTGLIAQRLDRLEEPLRLAMVGKIKAGKSTLLNAMLGEHVALTDVGECTNILTFYKYGSTPVVTLYPLEGPGRVVRFRRSTSGLDIDRGDIAVEDVKHIVVRWPSDMLRSVTLIDTPGIDSISTNYAHRTTTQFTAEAEDAAADVVLYLMRHLHASDVRFLKSFQEHFAGDIESLNTVSVLSRADEIGAGRIDAMIAANRVAERYATDRTLRTLCQAVVPVSGLLAATGRTLTRAEFTALTALANAPREVVEDLLLSADRFGRPDAPVPVSRTARIELFERLGAFGIRLAVVMIRAGMRDHTLLADDLVQRSGFAELRTIVDTLFTGRSDLHKARAALLVVSAIVAARPRAEAEELTDRIEALFTGWHEFRELALLASLQRGGYTLDEGLIREAERLLGMFGTSAVQRLGQPADTPYEVQRELAVAALQRWRDLVIGPFHSGKTLELCELVCRSCEELVVSLGGVTARYDLGVDVPRKRSRRSQAAVVGGTVRTDVPAVNASTSPANPPVRQLPYAPPRRAANTIPRPAAGLRYKRHH